MNVPQTFFSARVDPYNIDKGGYQASDVPVVLLVAAFHMGKEGRPRNEGALQDTLRKQWCSCLPDQQFTILHMMPNLEKEIYIARAPGRLDVLGGNADYSWSLVLQGLG
ncbi:uncharacterized protein LOC120672858 [Panicum virgatum]|uniref:uncharacterized protein LOC120672858 n=1 Tax=Panicum virgatum TaxID=38727 RepID=UPI0019D52131|nr:uncharacterized protein LOC120672858 [Panicum virgatum]XP_039809397.1 uncharacterized protein LOC120672858 [Panicum virgatum]